MTKLDAEVFLVRHGETAWNAEGRFQGQLDSLLTQPGREHAGKNGRLLPAALAGRAAVTMQVSPLGSRSLRPPRRRATKNGLSAAHRYYWFQVARAVISFGLDAVQRLGLLRSLLDQLRF